VTHVLPFPLLSLALAVMWLLLQGSLAPGTVLLAALLGLLVPQTMRVLTPEKPSVRNPRALLRLAGIVIYDIIRSNVAVATIVLRPRRRHVSGFVVIPLDLRSRYGLAALAIIVTCTPGTLWVQYNPRRGTLLLHVLDLVDESEWLQLIKGRYERLLLQVFE
jgi:multicomponent K+:H+ antiporter subunit E